MLIKSITMRPGAHFHARPAADLAVLARQFESVLLISVGEELADAKNALSGPDEEEAAASLEKQILTIERLRK